MLALAVIITIVNGGPIIACSFDVQGAGACLVLVISRLAEKRNELVPGPMRPQSGCNCNERARRIDAQRQVVVLPRGSVAHAAAVSRPHMRARTRDARDSMRTGHEQCA